MTVLHDPEPQPLTRHALIGDVARRFFGERLADTGQTADGTARFILRYLTPPQVAAIARALVASPELHHQIEIKLPRHYLEGQGLPDEVLTDERATYFRNKQIHRPALLVANTGDDEAQSLEDLTRVGSHELLSHPRLWVDAAEAGLLLDEQHHRWWTTALGALADLRSVSLDLFADYVLRARQGLEGGLTLDAALGDALPVLRLPRNPVLFQGIPTDKRTQRSKWRDAYTTAKARHAPFLEKQQPSSGAFLSDKLLREAFKNVKGSIQPEFHPVIEAFLDAPMGWSPQSADLAECEWEQIRPLFDGLKRVKGNLGEDTQAFFKERHNLNLTEDELTYLAQLVKRNASEAEFDEDHAFYEKHKALLLEDRQLRSQWDRFVFGKPQPSPDFLVGLLECLRAFTWDTRGQQVQQRTLVIRSERHTPADLQKVNVDALRHFAFRYRGLEQLLPEVKWDTGDLFDAETLYREWATSKNKKKINKSEKKDALELKFTVELRVRTVDGVETRTPRQVIWHYRPQAITSALREDWERLTRLAHPLWLCSVDREVSGTAAGEINLGNVQTLVPSYAQQRGSLVGAFQKKDRDRNLKGLWEQNLQDAVHRNFLSSNRAAALSDRFATFETAYGDALRSYLTQGVASGALEEQAERYGELLRELTCTASSDSNRQHLLRPVLSIGAAQVHGRSPALIVAPWHPLRLLATRAKALRFAEAVRRLLNPEMTVTDAKLFFQDKLEEFASAYYPDVALGWLQNEPRLLALTDTLGEYTLHEPAVAPPGRGPELNDNPAESAARVTELVGRYLDIQPHERANLSVVLYNCDSSRLPMAVVSRLAALGEDDDAVRCQVMLHHDEPAKLHQVYERVLEQTGHGEDEVVASELTRDFMARLRIGVLSDAPPAAGSVPHDLVFLQDVVARQAKLSWHAADAEPVPLDRLNPVQWSRRRPMASGDMKSVVFLTCPAQTAPGRDYLNAVASFFGVELDPAGERYHLPARQLDFQDHETERVLQRVHALGAWVANHDELLDRRQLVQRGIRVIKYKKAAAHGRNLVISSGTSLALLEASVVRRLKHLGLELEGAQLRELARRLIHDANDLSGDIVLRAARRGTSASELIGVALSRHLVRHELGEDQPTGWFFLDDYAAWLGQREEQIADLLALAPKFGLDGGRELHVVVTEAKYIDAGSLAGKSKESAKQLLDTLNRFAGALDYEHPRLDREMWVSRLSDLLVDGTPAEAHPSIDLQAWRRSLRDGECRIVLRGYSHVFVSGGDGDSLISPLPAEGALAAQEVVGVQDLRALLRSYHERVPPCLQRPHHRASDGAAGTSARPPRTPTPASWTEGSATSGAGATADDKSPPTPSKPGSPAARTPWAYDAVRAWLADHHVAPGDDAAEEAWLHQTATRAKVALQSFGLQHTLVATKLTPNSALLHFQGSDKLTVEQVEKKRTQFLTSHALRLLDVRPGYGTVTLVIGRPQRQVIDVKAVWPAWPVEEHGVTGNRQLLVGLREDNGEPLVVSPGGGDAPHLLIAGSTGSGKSVLLQNLLLGLAATNRPTQTQVILIDPKKVDYLDFAPLPHLSRGIITEQAQALGAIEGLVAEMEERYRRFMARGVKHLAGYNRQVEPHQRLPVLWLVHDEFAEWMLQEDYRDQVVEAVSRLGVKARAAGIHLVFAAQRPDATVVPMQLRSQLGNRLVLKVDSAGTSEIALTVKGAEHLLGYGHMLVKRERDIQPVYVQVPYVAEEEIAALVDAISREEQG